MFKDENTARAVREHMLNAMWLMTASARQSPVREATDEERERYEAVVDRICTLIESDVLLPIFQDHPALTVDSKSRYTNRNR
jgi:hypothetical protein